MILEAIMHYLECEHKSEATYKALQQDKMAYVHQLAVLKDLYTKLGLQTLMAQEDIRWSIKLVKGYCQHKIIHSGLLKRFTLLFRLVKYRQEIVNGSDLMIKAKAMMLFQEGIDVDHLDNEVMTPLFQALLKHLTDMESTPESSVVKETGKGPSNKPEERNSKPEQASKKDADESTHRRGNTASEYIKLKNEYILDACANNHETVSTDANLEEEVKWEDKRLTHDNKYVYTATKSKCHKCHISTEGKAHIPHCLQYACNKCKYYGHNAPSCGHKTALDGVLANK